MSVADSIRRRRRSGVRHLGYRQDERRVARHRLQATRKKTTSHRHSSSTKIPLPLVAIGRIPHVHESRSNDFELNREELREPNPASKPSPTVWVGVVGDMVADVLGGRTDMEALKPSDLHAHALLPLHECAFDPHSFNCLHP